MNLRDLERQSIRNFVQHCADAGHFRDRDVLDYGCGQQPYRDIVVMGGGRYTGYDLTSYPANVSGQDHDDDIIFDSEWGAILCTQVVQYVEEVPTFLMGLHGLLEDGGVLCITWPTNWPEVEPEDLHRFTLMGMARMLRDAGFSEVGGTPRAFIEVGPEKLYVGHGAIAWK